MYWKTTNIQLKDGYRILRYGDSALFFRDICMNNILV